MDNLGSRKRSKDLEEYYKTDVMGAIKEKLDNIVRLYKELDGSQDIEPRQIKRIFKPVSLLFENLKKIYDYMYFFQGDDIRPEAYLLRDQIKESFQNIKIFKEVNIFQTYEYNFLERQEDINKMVSGLQIENHGPISLFLPEIEINNPLMWTQLSHEMAHVYINTTDVIPKIKRELLKEIIGIHKQKVFDEWAKEIVSDVIALRLFGIGYYTSFISTTIKTGSLRTHTVGHPSHKTRVDIMSELLVSTPDIPPEFKEMVDWYSKIFGLWTEWGTLFNSDHLIFIDPNEEKRAEKENAINSFVDRRIPLKIARSADKQIDNILKEVYHLDEIEKLNRLSGVLNRGIIISSCRAKEEGDIKNTIDKFEPGKDDAYELISTLTEMPNSIFEIINGGWMYRYKHYYPKIKDSLFSENMAFEDRYENFKKETIRYDELLLKSIENAQLHLIFKRSGS